MGYRNRRSAQSQLISVQCTLSIPPPPKKKKTVGFLIFQGVRKVSIGLKLVNNIDHLLDHLLFKKTTNQQNNFSFFLLIMSHCFIESNELLKWDPFEIS